MLNIQIESFVPADLDQRFRGALENKFFALSEQLYRKVIENVSGTVLQQRSGELARSIWRDVDIVGDTLTASVAVRPETPKALALEFGGSKSYAIYPSKARVLHFFWDKVGAWVYLTGVSHPPSREFAYLRKALAELEPIVVSEMRDTAREVLGG